LPEIALVTDDEPDSREISAFVLEQAGAIVNSVESGMDALQILVHDRLTIE
jgi:CheY-like chemotaxis protein